MGELGEIVTGSTPPIANEEYYSDKGIPWITPTDIETNIISDSAKKLSAEGAKIGRVVRANSILCTCIASIGKNALLTTNGSFNQQINSLTPYSDNDSYFLLTSSELWSIQMKQIASSGTMQIVNKTEFSELRTMIPSLPEQEAIGTFFSTLDCHITLHQRKLDKLKSVKQAYLSEMFPAEGERVPKRRFPGFTDAWELRKVGELLTERNEQAPMNDEFPLMAFIANEGVAPKGERYDRSSLVNDTAGKLYKKTRFGDFIYSSNNLETGSIGLNKYGNASVSPVYSIFEATGIADSDFIGRRLVRKDFINAMIKWRQGVVYGQWKIHESDFVKIEVAVPSVDEQRQIGEFLDTLDQQITLHQRKSI